LRLKTGTPSICPAGVIVRIDVFALNLDDPETVAKTSDQPRGRWLLATAGDALVDPQTRPAAHGAGRAAPRRERGAGGPRGPPCWPTRSGPSTLCWSGTSSSRTPTPPT